MARVIGSSVAASDRASIYHGALSRPGMATNRLALKWGRRLLPRLVRSGAGVIVRKSYFERGAGGGWIPMMPAPVQQAGFPAQSPNVGYSLSQTAAQRTRRRCCLGVASPAAPGVTGCRSACGAALCTCPTDGPLLEDAGPEIMVGVEPLHLVEVDVGLFSRRYNGTSNPPVRTRKPR